MGDFWQDLTLGKIATGISVAVLIGGFFVQYFVMQANLDWHIKDFVKYGQAQSDVNERNLEVINELVKQLQANEKETLRLQIMLEMKGK